MDDQLFHPIIPEGMHLANPHDDPNAFLGALFDEGNHLYGQARWELADAGDEDNDDGVTGSRHMRRWPWAFSSVPQWSEPRPIWQRTRKSEVYGTGPSDVGGSVPWYLLRME